MDKETCTARLRNLPKVAQLHVVKLDFPPAYGAQGRQGLEKVTVMPQSWCSSDVQDPGSKVKAASMRQPSSNTGHQGGGPWHLGSPPGMPSDSPE